VDKAFLLVDVNRKAHVTHQDVPVFKKKNVVQ